MMDYMHGIVTDNQVEPIAPDYKLAFGQLAYLVGRLSETTDEARKALIVKQAERLIEAVYNPVAFALPSGEGAIAELFRVALNDTNEPH